jgi:hypothetical protein
MTILLLQSSGPGAGGWTFTVLVIFAAVVLGLVAGFGRSRGWW